MMKKRSMKLMAWLLSLALLISVLPASAMADTVSENSVSENTVSENSTDENMVTGEEEFRKNTYMDVEEEMLDEDRYPRISMFSVRPEGNGATVIPSSYRSDAVEGEDGSVSNYLPTAFRNQNPYGTCWAFAAIGASEASLIRKGLADGNIDLSERHLAYYFYNKGNTSDTKGGTYADYNIIDRYELGLGANENYLNAGGNSTFTMWHLASWCGPVEETAAPYSGIKSDAAADANGLLGEANSTAMAYENDACHVQNVYKIAIGDMDSMISYKQTVKKLIMEYGSLAMSYYSDDSFDDPEHDSYYNDSIEDSTNHAVQVVGWDDNFNKNYFMKNGEANPAPGDGAWLIKNSWGDESADYAQDGYFWLSYYDLSANAYVDENGNLQMRYAYVYDAEPADNYDNIYQYDGDASAWSLELPQYMNISNRFTVNNGKGLWEAVRSVGIGVGQSNVTGTVYIYEEPDNYIGDPTGGTLLHSQRISLEYPGYHTIPLSKDIYVGDGQQFTVVFAFDGQTEVCVSADYDSWLDCYTYENPFVSYWKSESGVWYDSADDALVFRIKAYTDETTYRPPMLTGFKMNKATAKVAAGQKLQLTATAQIQPASDGSTSKVFAQNWISSDTSVAKVSSTGLVTGVKPGKTKIMVYNNNITASCTVTVSPKKTTLSSVSLTSAGKAKLKWKKQSGVTGYQVYRATSENGKYKKVKTIKGASKVTVTLPANTGSKAYYYKVRAYKTISGKNVYGEYSSVKSCAPKKTSKITAKALKGKKAKVTWKKVSSANGYQVYRSTKKKGSYKLVKTITNKKTVSFTDKSLKKGKKYYYKVRAYRLIKGKKVYGPYSDIVYIKAK